MTDAEVQALAAGQLADYDTGMPGRAFAEPAFRLVLDDAYRVQVETARLRVLRGEAIAGYKIGCVERSCPPPTWDGTRGFRAPF